MFSSNIFKSTQPTNSISSATPTEEWVTLLTEASIQFEDSAFQGTYEFSQATALSSMDKNPSIVQEGLIDFTKSIINAIKNFIEKIKQFFTKYKLYITSYLGSFDNFMKKHSMELRNLNPKEFTITGFEFTRQAHEPNLDPLYGIISGYNEELKELDGMTISDLKQKKESYTLEHSGDWLRGQVMTMFKQVTAEEYTTEIFKFYRNGATEPAERTIGPDEFKDARVGYGLHKKYLHKIVDMEKSTIKIFNTLEKFFKDMPTTRVTNNSQHISTKSMHRNEETDTIAFSDGPSIDYSEDNISKVNLFYQYKWEQVRLLSPIITTAISGRITSFKDETKQSVGVIRKAILNSQIAQPEKKEEGDN